MKKNTRKPLENNSKSFLKKVFKQRASIYISKQRHLNLIIIICFYVTNLGVKSIQVLIMILNPIQVRK